MKNITLAVLVLAGLTLIGSGTARAEKWTATDTACQVVVLSMLAIDYAQTERIVNNPVHPLHTEKNPIIGPHGERVPPGWYFLGYAVLHTTVARVLPQPWRRMSQGLVIGMEAEAITSNWRLGYNWSMDF